jgi:hypothetical protein
MRYIFINPVSYILIILIQLEMKQLLSLPLEMQTGWTAPTFRSKASS